MININKAKDNVQKVLGIFSLDENKIFKPSLKLRKKISDILKKNEFKNTPDRSTI